MAIEKPYEILIRYDDKGAIQGAHMQKILIDETGNFPAKVLDPVPLSLDDGDEFSLKAAFGAASADSAAALIPLRAELADWQGKYAAAVEELAQTRADRDAGVRKFETDIADLKGRLVDLATTVSQAAAKHLDDME